MRKKEIIVIFSLLIASLLQVEAQKVYSVTSGEMIFSFADVKFTQEFLDTYPGTEVVKNPLRYTIFFHLGQYWHIDFGNNVGLITGLGMRNVGFISDETLPEMIDNSTGVLIDYKIIRRTYALGVPLMLKFGSFKDHLYFFGGAEYELAFHFKEKYWTNTHDRSGTKTKSTTWFAEQMPTFLPSVIGGIQLPGGVNIKFKYYLSDFLDHKYAGSGGNASTYDVSNLTRYDTSQVFYISLSWQFNTAYITKKEWQSTDIAYR